MEHWITKIEIKSVKPELLMTTLWNNYWLLTNVSRRPAFR